MKQKRAAFLPACAGNGRPMMRPLFLCAALIAGVGLLVAEPQVTKESVPGIVNFARLETTVACAGAVTPAAVAGVKKMGFKAIVNLRLATEAGADVEAEARAAETAGLRFLHFPIDGQAPDPAVVERFLQAMRTPGNQPALVHCASGNRAAALWMIKRALGDGWETDRALAEAGQLGTISPTMKSFAIDYVQSHRTQETTPHQE